MVRIKFKRLHPDAVVPVKAKASDTGFDIVAIDNARITADYIEYRTGIAVEMPTGYGLQIRPRSSISKYGLVLCNGPGTLDEGYRGEIIVRFNKVTHGAIYRKGDRIAQLTVEEVIPAEFVEVNELSQTDRGIGGFGSSGINTKLEPPASSFVTEGYDPKQCGKVDNA